MRKESMLQDASPGSARSRRVAQG